jgi:hypothetical protein
MKYILYQSHRLAPERADVKGQHIYIVQGVN